MNRLEHVYMMTIVLKKVIYDRHFLLFMTIVVMNMETRIKEYTTSIDRDINEWTLAECLDFIDILVTG